MGKLYFNTRDELTCLEVDLVAFVRADGNYSKVVYITGKEITLTFGISKLETILKEHNDKRNRFDRIGRSIIINHFYLYKIEPMKQIMILSDGGSRDLRIAMPKQNLRAYKDAIHKRVERITKP